MRRFLRTRVRWAVAAVVSAAGTFAFAQPPSDAPQRSDESVSKTVLPAAAYPEFVPTPDGNSYEELLERLRTAEQRIADLETVQAEAGERSDSAAGHAQLSDATEESDGDGADVTERLETLESGWKEFQAELDDAEAEKRGEPTFEIGGRIHFDHWTFLEDSEGIHFFEHPDASDPQFGTDPEDRFVFRRIRLEMQGEVPDLMLWRVQVDFNNPSDPEYKDVYLGWRLPHNHTLTIGNQKRPIGLDHLNSSRFNVFAERPLAVEAFNEDARRLGLLMTGFADDRRYNWQYGVFNLENTATTGRYIGDTLQLGGYGRLATTPWYDETSDGCGYLHLALAGSLARPDGDVSAGGSNGNEARFRTRPEGRSSSRWIDTGAIDGAEWFEQIGTEAVLNVGAVQFVGEYLTTWVQRDDATAGSGPDTFFHGGYAYASYFLTGEHMPWDRESGTLDRVTPLENFFLVDRCTGGTGGGWGAWQVKARYDHLDLTDADIRGGVENNLTFGLNWYWNAYAKVQFDVTRGLIEQHRSVGGFESGDFWLAGTRFAIDF